VLENDRVIKVISKGNRETHIKSVFLRDGKEYTYHNGRVYVVRVRDNGDSEIIVRAKSEYSVIPQRKKVKAKRDNPYINEDYLDRIRSMSCLVCPNNRVDPHHLKTRKWRESTRDDYSAIPLCRYHHGLVEQIGLTEFNNRFHINLWTCAFGLVCSYFLMKENENA
jgi:hypothetical protein